MNPTTSSQPPGPRRDRPWAALALALASLAACAGDGDTSSPVPTVRPGQPHPPGPAAASGPVEARTPLERGLAAIRPACVAADVAFLADDVLEGRDTPSPGLRVAARYVVNRLASLGLEPGAEGGWYQVWTLTERRLTAEHAHARLVLAGDALVLRYGVDFAVYPSDLRDGELAGELVWCAEGTREDFEGLDLGGAIAVCLEGSESRARLRHRAEQAGAAGLLILEERPGTPDGEAGDDEPGDGAEEPDEPDEPERPRFREWSERLARTVHYWPSERLERLPTYWLGGAARAALLARGRELGPGEPLGGRFEGELQASREIGLENVCALWPGRDPELAREVILISAHYDHVGVHDGEVFNGADDNASGTAALLALAEALVAHGPLERSVLLLFVSGEEKGLFGSRAWAEAPWFPPALGDARALCNINLDMVGRNEPGMLEYTPTAEHDQHNGLARRVPELAAAEGFDDLRSADKDFWRSDHASFAEHLGIPVLYVSAGEHDDYHQASDTAEKVDDDKVARFARLVLRLVADLQAPDAGLVVQPPRAAPDPAAADEPEAQAGDG